MIDLYDELVRLGLKPERDFKFNKKTDSLMVLNERGVRTLVRRHWAVKIRKLHVSMIPLDTGVVDTALVTAADARKRPGFWHVILDINGRPVAEHPLTYSKMEMEPHDPSDPDSVHQPPSGPGAVEPCVETTGELTRMLVSWLVGYDRVNDDASAAILEILSVHSLSPREVNLPIKSREIAQRFHDELVCFEEDSDGIISATVQAAKLRETLALLLNEDRV